MAKKQWINLGLSVVVGGGLVFGLSNPLGPAPALAPAFNPGTGVWKSAAEDLLLPKTEELKIPGLQAQVKVIFEKDGTAHIVAENDQDAFAATGYLHARNRLVQMDLSRRQAAGHLAEVAGADMLNSDQFQLQLGIERAAKREWEEMQKSNSPLAEKLQAYSDGINAVIDEQIKAGTLPVMFKILGYEPKKWTPVDTLVLKGLLAQMMSIRGNAVYLTLFADKMGEERARDVMPILSPNEEHPFDLGPYQERPLEPMPISAEAIFQGASKTAGTEPTSAPTKLTAGDKSVSIAAMTEVAKLLNQLPQTVLQQSHHSNAWVVDGTKSASGKPLMAGDPHLTMSMPSIWYQLELQSPGYNFKGVTMPGLPQPLIGQNENISWTMTDGQEQQTFYYKEQTDEAHPNQYYWKGAWHDFVTTVYEIPVKGQGTVRFEGKSSVHGPLAERVGMNLTLNWIGNMPGTQLEGLDQMVRTKNYDEFKASLKNWTAPIMNFVYADKQGNIGLVAAGQYPVFNKGQKPWLALPGNGEGDIIGRIPFDAVPQTYNPPSHFIHTANQRPVKPDYPYYIGTTWDFDLSYRANRLYDVLSADKKFTPDDFKQLQLDQHDVLAAKMVPELMKNMAGQSLNKQEKAALERLAKWDYVMGKDSVEATIWWKFWERYLRVVFKPWWDHYKIWPKDIPSMEIFAQTTITPALETWTLQEPNKDWFNNPLTGEKGDAKLRMQQAFRLAVSDIEANLGSDADKWTWGSIHKRSLESLVQVPALGVPGRPEGGDQFTLNIMTRGLGHNLEKDFTYNYTYGPSWRMIVDWGTGKSEGIYPGGQTENPVSPMYTERVDEFMAGKYRDMLWLDEAQKRPDTTLWTLVPGK